MQIEMDVSGMEDLLKAFERAASDDEIRAANRKIVDMVKPETQETMAKKIPRSRDLSKSGRWFGVKSQVSTHAADSVPAEKTKTRGTSASAEVGWKLSDHSDYFYMKFMNWGADSVTKDGRGAIHHPELHFVEQAGEYAEGRMQKVAEQEYKAFLDKTLGG